MIAGPASRAGPTRRWWRSRLSDPPLGRRGTARLRPRDPAETNPDNRQATVVLGVVVLLGALLLMLAFRSIVIPLTAAVMNLLSAGAAFGVVVVVAAFTVRVGTNLLGLGSSGPVEAFLPVMMLGILFGLSMDYQDFLVSRMHEEWARTGDNHKQCEPDRLQPGGSSGPPPRS